MRTRLALIGACVLVALTGGVTYVGVARDRVGADLERRNEEAEAFLDDWEPGDPAPAADTGPDTIQPFHDGDLVFVNQVPGPDFGRLALWRGGERVLLDIHCDRAHASTDRLTCLRPAGGPGGQRSTVERYSVTEDGFEAETVSATGVPSRARTSGDGRLGAGTVFVQGHSYLEVGEFATATSIFEETADGVVVHDLENDFDAGDDQYRVGNGNWWGVTFGPGPDEFFVTFGVGDSTEILQGDVSTGRVSPFVDDMTCPSLSPEGSTIVAKQPDGDGGLELVAIDVESRSTTALGEPRFVEDQVEWLDEDTILYALPHEGAADGPQPAMDVWSLDLDPDANPELLLPFAASPGLVRTDA